jgi:hypothetical protein
VFRLLNFSGPPANRVLSSARNLGLTFWADEVITAVGEFMPPSAVLANNGRERGMTVLEDVRLFVHAAFAKPRDDRVLPNALGFPQARLFSGQKNGLREFSGVPSY